MLRQGSASLRSHVVEPYRNATRARGGTAATKVPSVATTTAIHATLARSNQRPRSVRAGRGVRGSSRRLLDPAALLPPSRPHPKSLPSPKRYEIEKWCIILSLLPIGGAPDAVDFRFRGNDGQEVIRRRGNHAYSVSAARRERLESSGAGGPAPVSLSRTAEILCRISGVSKPRRPRVVLR